jgi:hypothetical protein
MTEHLLHLQVQGHATDLTERARTARLARVASTRDRPRGRLRASTARLLVALAVRLDDRLRPAPVRAARSGTGG